MENKKYTADEYRWAELACQRVYNSSLEQSLPEAARLDDPHRVMKALITVGKAMEASGIKVDSPH